MHGGVAMRKAWFLSSSVTLFAALMTLSGCATLVNTYDSFYLSKHNRADYNYQVGSTNVAVLSVTPWEDVVGTLKPDFKMDANTALDKSIPTTMRYEQKIIDAMLARLKVALPATSISSSDTTSVSSTTGVSSTSVSTRDKKPGDPNTVPTGTSVLQLDAPPISGKSAIEGDVGLDPMVKYTAANALFQEVKLLNRYVSDAAVGTHSRAYVVRLQVSVMPYQRNMPYDTYVNITFLNPEAFNPGAKGSIKSPAIIPLLVTDDLEAMASSRSIETVRQLELALMGMINGTGAQADLEKSMKNTENIRGQSVNSLLTVGRINDNTLRIRLGAMQQGNSLYAVVPSTHNISVLLFVPEEFASEPSPIVKLGTLTRFRDTVRGNVLPDSGQNKEFKKRLKKVLNEFESEDDNTNIETAEKMIEAIDDNDYPAFRQNYAGLTQKKNSESTMRNKGCWASEDTKDMKECDKGNMTDFYVYLVNAGEDSVINYANVPLPSYEESIPMQTVLAFDNNEKITAVVNKVRGVDVKDIESAELKIGGLELQPAAIIPTETNGIEFVYPSLSNLGLPGNDGKKCDGAGDGKKCDTPQLLLRVKSIKSKNKSEDELVPGAGRRQEIVEKTSEPSQGEEHGKKPESPAIGKYDIVQCTDTEGKAAPCKFTVRYVKTAP